MNYNQHFDKHIKEQLQDYSPQVHPRIWENIVKEREKKRPAGFWWQIFNSRNRLLVAGLLIVFAGGGAYYFLKTNSTGNKPGIAATINNAAEKPKSNSTSLTAGEISTESKPVSGNTGNDSKTSAANPPGTGNNSTTGNIDTYTNTFAAAPDNNDKTKNTLGSVTKSYTNNGRQKITVKNGEAAFEDEEETINPLPEYSLPFIFYTAQKNTAAKAVASLRNRNLGNVKEPGCPTIEKNAAGNKTYIEVYGGPDYAFRSLSDTGNSVYLQKRKESTKFSSAFSAGFRYTKVFSNGVSVRAGINYSQINEKFTYSEGNIVQVVYIINAAGDTIGSYMTTGSRYKTTYNKFRTIDVPVVLGYELGNGNLHANVNAGVIINAYSWQKGEVLDATLQPVDITTGKSNSPYQFKTNIGVGFIGGVSVYYKLNEKLHLMAEPYFRYNLTPASKENITFKQKYNTAGLRLGVRLDLK